MALLAVAIVGMNGMVPFTGGYSTPAPGNSSSNASNGQAAPSGGQNPSSGASEGAGVAAGKDGAGPADGSQATDDASSAKVSKPARTPEGVEVPEDMIPEVNVEHEQQEVLVTFSGDWTADQLTQAITASGCTVPQSITPAEAEDGFATLKVADGYDVEHAMVQLGMLPELDGAQPNYIYRLQGDVAEKGAAGLKADIDSPSLPETLNTARSGESLLAQETTIDDAYRSSQWMLTFINAYRAWDIARADGAVTVAVLDNGFKVTHEDLAANMLADAAYNAVSGSGSDVSPYYGRESLGSHHGTHVAGIVAAEANNGKGVAGVSYNANILPIQVFEVCEDDEGEYLGADTSSLVRAYRYVMDNADRYSIRVVNMSLGATLEGESIESVDLDQSDKAFLSAIDEAYRQGILTVCSAGNDADTNKGAYLNYPSDWAENALGVIALQNGSPAKRASYSNYNMEGQTTKDIAAPGSSVYSTFFDSNRADSYAYMSGTSMASPCVAGVAALVYAAKPDATAAQVADIICMSADKQHIGSASFDENGFSREYGYGAVDAEAAVLRAKGPYLDGDTTVLQGKSLTLTPANYDSNQVSGDWTWSSSDPSIASVSDGVVTGHGAGNVTISASSGDIELTSALVVYSAQFSGASTVAYGSTQQLRFASNPVRGTWYVESSDKSIVSLSATQDSCNNDSLLVCGGKCGTAEVTATLASNPAVQVSHTVTVTPAALSNATISPIGAQLYTGKAVRPKPTITFNGLMLVEGIDYTLDYSNNVEINANTSAANAPTVIVTGKGNFTGTERVTFKIGAEALIASDIWVTPQIFTYDGTLHKPIVRVFHNGKWLKESNDYSLEYANNRDAGTASVIVTGKGSYTGTLAKTFTIKKAPVAVPTDVSGLSYTGDVQEGVKADAHYTLSGNTAVNAGTYKAKARLKDTSNYEWADGATSAKSIAWRIAPASLAGAHLDGMPAYRYRTGKAVKPAVAVTMGSRTLAPDSDYTLSYSNNVNEGTAVVVAKGGGNYTGTVSASFRIIGKPRYKGASSMPVKSTAQWTLENCTLKVLDGADVVSLSGKTVRAKTVGTARLGVYDAMGMLVATRTVSVYRLSGKTRYVKSAIDPGYALTVKGASKANGANVYLRTAKSSKAYRFVFSLKTDGTYTLKNKATGRYVSVNESSVKSGANICQRKWLGYRSQRWSVIVDAKNRLTFVNKHSGKAMAVDGARATNGRNVAQYTVKVAKAQRWLLATKSTG